MSFFPDDKDSISAELEFGGTSLGEILGGVKLKYSRSTFKGKADSTGETARSETITGASVSVSCALTYADLEAIGAVSFGTLNSGETRLALSHEVGRNLLEDADELIIKPIVDGVADTDDEHWIYIPKAVPVIDFDTTFKLGEQVAWAVTFEGHPVLADDIASGGYLNGKGYAAGELLVLGA